MHGARGGAPEGERNGNYRHGARSKETIEGSLNRYADHQRSSEYSRGCASDFQIENPAMF